MNPSEGPNPEHRSNNALWVFCTGIALCSLAYFFGIGAIMATAFSGGDPAVVIGSLVGVIGIALLGVVGFILTAIGGVWMVLRVIADQTGDQSEKRYRNVDR